MGSFSDGFAIRLVRSPGLSVRWYPATSPLLRRSRSVPNGTMVDATLDTRDDGAVLRIDKVLVASIEPVDSNAIDLGRHICGSSSVLGRLHRWAMGIAIHQESDTLGDCVASGAFDEPCVLHLCGCGDGSTVVVADILVLDYCGFNMVDDAAVDGAADRLEVLLTTWRVCLGSDCSPASSRSMEDLEFTQNAHGSQCEAPATCASQSWC